MIQVLTIEDVKGIIEELKESKVFATQEDLKELALEVKEALKKKK